MIAAAVAAAAAAVAGEGEGGTRWPPGRAAAGMARKAGVVTVGGKKEKGERL